MQKKISFTIPCGEQPEVSWRGLGRSPIVMDTGWGIRVTRTLGSQDSFSTDKDVLKFEMLHIMVSGILCFHAILRGLPHIASHPLQAVADTCPASTSRNQCKKYTFSFDAAISFLYFVSPCGESCSFNPATRRGSKASSIFVNFGCLTMRVDHVWIDRDAGRLSSLGLLVD